MTCFLATTCLWIAVGCGFMWARNTGKLERFGIHAPPPKP